jgi:hypothetical protein
MIDLVTGFLALGLAVGITALLMAIYGGYK